MSRTERQAIPDDCQTGNLPPRLLRKLLLISFRAAFRSSNSKTEGIAGRKEGTTANLALHIATSGHYSGVYPLLHRGTPNVHFRVNLPRYPQRKALNPARVDMREIGVRIAISDGHLRKTWRRRSFAAFATPVCLVADFGRAGCGDRY